MQWDGSWARKPSLSLLPTLCFCIDYVKYLTSERHIHHWGSSERSVLLILLWISVCGCRIPLRGCEGRCVQIVHVHRRHEFQAWNSAFVQLGMCFGSYNMTWFLSEHGIIILIKFRCHSAIALLSIVPFAVEEGNFPAVAVELACAARKVALCAADQSG